MPKVDLESVAERTGTIYPTRHQAEMEGRSSLRFSDSAGLTQFGANITILQPGAKSSLRHWHENQDELIMVMSGTATLIDDHGETELCAGDCAAFPKGEANGHTIVNKSNAEVRFLAVGTRTPTEVCWYSDLDMKVTIEEGKFAFTRKDGSPYPGDNT